MPFKPEREQVQSAFLCKSIQLMPLGLLLEFAHQVQAFRIEECPLLKLNFEDFRKQSESLLCHFELELPSPEIWKNQHLQILEPFFRKEVKSKRDEQKRVLLDRLSDQFFWTRVPLWRFQEQSLQWHPLWFYWLKENSLMVRELVLLRLLELQVRQNLNELRNMKIF